MKIILKQCTIIKKRISITIPPGIDKKREASDQEENNLRDKGTVAVRAPKVDMIIDIVFLNPSVKISIPDRAEKLSAAP